MGIAAMTPRAADLPSRSLLFIELLPSVAAVPPATPSPLPTTGAGRSSGAQGIGRKRCSVKELTPEVHDVCSPGRLLLSPSLPQLHRRVRGLGRRRSGPSDHGGSRHVHPVG